MNERIKEIAMQSSDFAEQIPYFHGIKNGLTWEGAIQKARDLKFAELIVRECADIAQSIGEHGHIAREEMLEHFGIEE